MSKVDSKDASSSLTMTPLNTCLMHNIVALIPLARIMNKTLIIMSKAIGYSKGATLFLN